MGTSRTTLADVARRAGVSQTAASFVLSGRREEMRISAAVEARVLQAARETGYRPNIVSRSLRTGTSHTIGFISDTVATTPFAGHLIWGALDAARDKEHLLFIGETEGDPDLEQQLIEAMHDRGVDGIVLARCTHARSPSRKPSSSDSCPAQRGPRHELHHPVGRPRRGGGRKNRRSLPSGRRPPRRYRPHRRGTPEPSTKDSLAGIQRLQGIAEVLHDAGAEIVGAIPCPDWQPELGYDATRKLLRKGRPSALICFNDRIALGAYQALADANLNVPGDVSVVSFDDDLMATWIRPQLTTVASHTTNSAASRSMSSSTRINNSARKPSPRSIGSLCRSVSATRSDRCHPQSRPAATRQRSPEPVARGLRRSAPTPGIV